MLLAIPRETLQDIVSILVKIAGFQFAAYALPKVCRAFRAEDSDNCIFLKCKVFIAFNECTLKQRVLGLEKRELQWKQHARDEMQGYQSRTRSEAKTALTRIESGRARFNADWASQYVKNGYKFRPHHVLFEMKRFLALSEQGRRHDFTDIELECLQLHIDYIVSRPNDFKQIGVKGFPSETSLLSDMLGRVLSSGRRFTNVTLFYVQRCQMRAADVLFLLRIPELFPNLRALVLSNVISTNHMHFAQLSDVVSRVSLMPIIVLNLSNLGNFVMNNIHSKMFSMNSFVSSFRKMSRLRVLNINGWPVGRKNWSVDDAVFLDYLRENKYLSRLEISRTPLRAGFCLEVCKAMNRPWLFDRNDTEELNALLPRMKKVSTFHFDLSLWLDGATHFLQIVNFLTNRLITCGDGPWYEVFNEMADLQYDSSSGKGVCIGIRLERVEGGIKVFKA